MTTSNGYQPDGLWASTERATGGKGDMLSDDLSIIDISEALKRTMGDVEFLQMMLAEFQRMIPDFMSRIEEAIQLNDMGSLAKDAHQFKGTAANLGAKIIAMLALQLEQMGKTGHAEKSESVYAELRQAVATFNEYLARIEWSTISAD